MSQPAAREKIIAAQWQGLSWRQVKPELSGKRTHPVRFSSAPDSAGLYRVTLTDTEWWQQAAAQIPVKASRRVEANSVLTGSWCCPVPLSVGRTTRLQHRLQQHLGINPFSNRLFKRLCLLFPDQEDELRARVITGLTFEITELPDWKDRFLLERYGSVVMGTLLDFDAEH